MLTRDEPLKEKASYLRLLALNAGERPFLMRRHQSFVLEVNRFDFSSLWASCTNMGLLHSLKEFQ